MGFTLMREVTGTLWQRLQERHRCYAHRGRPIGERLRHKAYRLLTVFWPVEVSRQRVKRRACGASCQPVNRWLAELGDHLNGELDTHWQNRRNLQRIAAHLPAGQVMLPQGVLLGLPPRSKSPSMYGLSARPKKSK